MLQLALTLVLPLLSMPADDPGKCPISGAPAKADVFVWQKVHFCCNDCRGRYAKENKISLDAGKCCVSGEPAKLECFLIDGPEVLYFCCGNCQGKLAKEKKLPVNPALGKVGKCPVSGRDGKTDFFLLKKVNFCCGKCQTKYATQNGIAITTKPQENPKPPQIVKKKQPQILKKKPKVIKPLRVIAVAENQLTPAEKAAHWELLFNGRDLGGFQKSTRDGKWGVRNGVLTGSQGKGVLATVKKYDDFILTTSVRISDTGEARGNSGIYIRSTGLLAHRDRWPDGHEIQIDHGDPEFWTGSIWKGAAAKKIDVKDGQWFTMKVQASGPIIRVWINGKLVNDHIQTGPVNKGPISFQVHHATDLVEFKNIKIQALRRA